MIGLATRLQTNPRLYGEDAYMAALLEGDEVVAASLRTPPHNLILSEMPGDLDLEPLAEDVASVFGSLPGALGPSAAVERFVGVWQARTGVGARIGIRQRSYQAEEAAPAGRRSRPAAAVRGRRPRARARLDGRLRRRGASGPNARGLGGLARPAARRDRAAGSCSGRTAARPCRWAASAASRRTASASGRSTRLRSCGAAGTRARSPRRSRGCSSTAGRRFCFLFTDLANPTSNSIYQRIGYRPVTDVDQWTFADLDGRAV